MSAQDADGWSILRPSADSRLIYVSSGGDDGTARTYLPADAEIGSDPYNPAGSVLPYATLGAALAQLRAGYPDYMLLRRGDTWVASGALFLKAGRSAAERSVLGTWGSNPARPVVSHYGVNLSWASYSAVVGIRFVASQRDPSSVDFAGYSTTGVSGFDGLAGYNGTLVGGLLIEDCWWDWFSGNVVQSPLATVPALTDIIIRRNIFTHNYSTNSHAQGLYSDRASILLEENVFDHNGWIRQGAGNVQAEGQATMFNHNTYFGGARDTIFRGNLFLRASSIGNKFTSNTPAGQVNQIKAWNLQIDDNLYVEGEVGISLGGNDDQGNGPRWRNVHVTNNVMMHIGRARPTLRTLGWGLDVQDWRGGLVKGNIFTSWGDAVLSNNYAFYSSGHTTGVEYADNIVYGVVGGNPLIAFRNGDTQGGVTFHGNEVQGSGPGALMQFDLGAGGFHDNFFSSTLDPSRWFTATGTPAVSLASYRTRSGDTTSIAGTRAYVDPGRTLETYLTGLGLPADLDGFVAELVRQSRFNWRPALTAREINRYVREGFCISGSASCR